jgi:AraC-like DNA-binding protein
MNLGLTDDRIRPLTDNEAVIARSTWTENVRVEYLRCRTEATLQCSMARPEVSLMWVRDRGSSSQINWSGQPAEDIAPGRARFWFFPEGMDAQGEVVGKGAYDCAAVSIDPAFLPLAVRSDLNKPVGGFSCDSLGRAFYGLATELAGEQELPPLFTDGWAMQALACVARASRFGATRPSRQVTGLAPWQLRRAQQMLRANVSEHLHLQSVAQACKLSISHFTRAFKASTGAPPHRWLLAARVEMARDLLARSATPLAEVAYACGFADQSHFSRVFGKFMGTSPALWRRENRV